MVKSLSGDLKVENSFFQFPEKIRFSFLLAMLAIFSLKFYTAMLRLSENRSQMNLNFAEREQHRKWNKSF